MASRVTAPFVANAHDDMNGQSSGFEMVDVVLVVPGAAFLQKFPKGIPKRWVCKSSVRDR
jgi:hypothetical protein